MSAHLASELFTPEPARGSAGMPAAQERLPFTVRPATSAEQLAKAVAIRHRAYGRHVPSLADQLSRPEPLDAEPGSAVLLAESKLDGEPLGTLRIQTNRHRPLALESSVALPRWLASRNLAEATRLGVSLGRVGHVVKTMLFKAFYLYCLQAGVEWMVITARAPLDRMYEALLFGDVFPGRGPVPMQHVGGIPHRVLGFEVESAEARWRAARHPMLGLFVHTRHPDIDLAAAPAAFETPVLETDAATALAA